MQFRKIINIKYLLVLIIGLVILNWSYKFFIQKVDTVFYVSNQAINEDRDTIDITITIDGVELVKDTLPIKDYHLYKYYNRRLNPGIHKIKITSDVGEAILEQRIFCFYIHYIIIEYYDYNPIEEDINNEHYFFSIRKRLTPLRIS